MPNPTSRWRTAVRLGALLLLLMGGVLWWNRPAPAPRGIGVAVAKGQLLSRMALPEMIAGEQLARDIALADPAVTAVLATKQTDFLYAVPLSRGEARQWGAEGCADYNCSQATFYNYTDGGTIAAIVNMDTGLVLDQVIDTAARPGASLQLLPDLLDIAGADPRVQAELGDIRTVPAVMVPMSTWLDDDACRDDWCIDLTFPSPAGDGRILHVVINTHQQAVARLFYTRAREERAPVPGEPQTVRSISLKPVEQTDEGPLFTNGCREQLGWNVCWEMTAHDGLDFRDATYDGEPVFTSLKLAQVEAFYAAWPGGYRDEIGFDASVPPKFDTLVTDLAGVEEGFEVRQLYTEPFDWPNCVCCYRYEQIVRFYAGGSFEMEFISHGPGCDDLSTYRPFWRLDLNLNGPGGDSIWQWSGNHWEEATNEFGRPLFEGLSPDGDIAVTFDGDVSYLWRPVHTDPLGVDDGRFFALQFREGEGDGPILPGPADSFRPPRQWLNNEPLSGENVVLWYVPTLQTKRGGPWWCSPDPEPEFNPCFSILRANRGVTDLTVVSDPPTATSTSEAAPDAGTATPSPPTPTPRPVQGTTAEEIILNSGCGACHLIGALGERGKVGPDLSNIGRVAGERMPSLSAEEYLRQSIVEPNAFIAPECPNGPCQPNVMPNLGARLSPAQVDTLVAFLLTLQDDGGGDTVEPTAVPAPADQEPTSGPLMTILIAGGLLLALALGIALAIWAQRGSAEERARQRQTSDKG